MKRRTLIKTSLAAGALGLLRFPALSAQERKSASANSGAQHIGYKKFSLGDLEVTIITDGSIKQSPVFPFVAPLASANEVKTLLDANFRPTDSVELAINIMVVRSRDRLVMLDTGFGNVAEPVAQGWLPRSLSTSVLRSGLKGSIGLKGSVWNGIKLSEFWDGTRPKAPEHRRTPKRKRPSRLSISRQRLGVRWCSSALFPRLLLRKLA